MSRLDSKVVMLEEKWLIALTRWFSSIWDWIHSKVTGRKKPLYCILYVLYFSRISTKSEECNIELEHKALAFYRLLCWTWSLAQAKFYNDCSRVRDGWWFRSPSYLYWLFNGYYYKAYRVRSNKLSLCGSIFDQGWKCSDIHIEEGNRSLWWC